MEIGLVVFIGHCGVIDTELWAIIKGLDFAWQNNCSKVITESESELAIKWIKRVENPNISTLNLV